MEYSMAVTGEKAPSHGIFNEKAAATFPSVQTLPAPARNLIRNEGPLFRKILDAFLGLREPMSGLTHLIGALLSVAGLWILMDEVSSPVRPWHLAGYGVFGIAMVLLYTISTLFHWLPFSKEGITRLRKIDHIMIFIFIAATYTPFCLVPFRGAFGWTMLTCIWLIAILGAVFKVFWIHVPKGLCVLLYLFAGWFSLAGTGPIFRTLQPWAIFWLFSGGISYCLGTLFYVLDTRDDRPPLFGYHDIFHLFVMCGSAAHFWVVYRYIGLFD